MKIVFVITIFLCLTACKEAQLHGPVGGAEVHVESLRSSGSNFQMAHSSNNQNMIEMFGRGEWDEMPDLAKFIWLGNFSIDPDLAMDEGLYLVTVKYGYDMDSNNDLVLDRAPKTVLGKWRAVMDVDTLGKSGPKVSVLTEAAFRYIEPLLTSGYSDNAILASLDDFARKTVSDINNDKRVDYTDVLIWSRQLTPEKYKGDIRLIDDMAEAITRGANENLLAAAAERIFRNHMALPPKRHPNIVLILVDDLGYGDVRANFIESKIATPHIDQLARQGMQFTDAHSGAAVCSPSRYGILTGQHFSRQDWNRIGQQLWTSMIDEDRLTLGELLQRNDYHTGAFGKWHLGQTFYGKNGQPGGPGPGTDWSRPVTGGPNDRGFDEFYGVLFTQAHLLLALVSNGQVTEVPTEVVTGWPKAKGYQPVDAMPAVTQKALDYIDWNALERPGQPFFLYFATPAIHDPIVPSPEFIGKSNAGAYGDFVMQTDAAVGKVVAKIEEYGLREDTLIIFTSDNGSHGRAGTGFPLGSVYERYGHKMNGNWRGIKGTLWEGGHRVPFIASWPGQIEPNSVANELIVLEDLMATLAAILQVELPPNSAEDSYNFLPYLDGTHNGPPIREYAVLNTFNGDPILRKGKWVLAFHLGSGGQSTENFQPKPGGPKGQLYDLEADPGQTTNLWLKRPEIVAELTAFYNAHVERGSSFGINRDTNVIN